jgi:microtubule-associated protein-like 1/2
MSIDLNPRENLLAVGYRNGLVVLLDCTSLKSLSKISNHKNPDKEVLSLVKFSPSGELLAIAYCPPISKIYIYQTSNRKKIGECRGSPSRITCIDFSMAGDFLIANNTSYEILFYNAQNGNQVTRATQFQDEQWATMSCKFSWQCQGVWPHLYADGSNINVVERSHSKQLLASGDDFSKIKLFRYPACQPKQFFNQFKGHSSHITGVKWSYDDRYLVSIGGLEKSVIQWKVIESKQDITYEYEEEK